MNLASVLSDEILPRVEKSSRYLGTGPEYVKVGTRVRYSLTDVRAWLDAQRRVRT